MRSDLVIVGTGGHAREVAAAVMALNRATPRYNLLGFLDDTPSPSRTSQLCDYGVGLLGSTQWLTERRDGVEVMIAIGPPKVRRSVVDRLQSLSLPFATVVHPSAILPECHHARPGLYVAARAVVSTSVEIGDHVHINIGSTVSHDCALGSYVTLAPGVHLAGNVRVHTGVDIGVGAVAIPGIEIAAWGVVGAGAVVIHNVESAVTVAGVPARPIRTTHV